jgi:hypothetical protein
MFRRRDVQGCSAGVCDRPTAGACNPPDVQAVRDTARRSDLTGYSKTLVSGVPELGTNNCSS